MSSPPERSELEGLIEAGASSHGITLGPEIISQLAHHLHLVFRWNERTHLTSIRDPREAVERHVLESVVGSRALIPAAGPALDIGSGNGYPGLAMKICRPELSMTLLEPSVKKSAFLTHVSSELHLENLHVVRSRVDSAGDLAAFAPLGTITMRAVAAVGAVCRGAERALVPGGRLILYLGKDQLSEAKRSTGAFLALEQEIPLPGRSRAGLVVWERRPGA